MPVLIFVHGWCIFLNRFECLILEYVGKMVAVVLHLRSTLPSYKAAATLYSQDASSFLSSGYELADKQALVEHHGSRFTF